MHTEVIGMAIFAKVTRFTTTSYSRSQTDAIQKDGSSIHPTDSKAINEEVFAIISAENTQELHNRLVELCKTSDPIPIVVITPNNNEDKMLKHAFLMGKPSEQSTHDKIYETILYTRKDAENNTTTTMDVKRSKEGLDSDPIHSAEISRHRRQFLEDLLAVSFRQIGFPSYPREVVDSIVSDIYDNKTWSVYSLGLDRPTRGELKDRITHRQTIRPNDDGRQDSVKSANATFQGNLEDSTDLTFHLTDEFRIICRIIGKSLERIDENVVTYGKAHHLPNAVFSTNNELIGRKPDCICRFFDSTIPV